MKKSKKQKIIIGVLALVLVVVALGLGLGLGLKGNPEPHVSCKSRCYEPYDDMVLGCRCDSNCAATNSCCIDFHDLCTAPTEQWECTKLRCGEKRLTQSKCHCSDDCLSAGGCCTNYKHVCHGEREWVEGSCPSLAKPSCPTNFKQQPLLLVSLDGLRADYMQTLSAHIPVLTKLKTCGTSAPYMQAAFPSKTFPNHYTIVTGLYPESNGLIDNVMYDPVFNATFSLSNNEKDNPAWYLGQPIWHTAEYQGLKAGTFFWPGSDVKVNGTYPDIFKPYDGKVPFEERVFTVLQWLQLPDDKRPDFYTLYLEEPDKSGHSYGPVSEGLTKAIQGVDRIMGQLMNGLEQLGLHRCVNIIILADHGMEDTNCSRKEVLQEFVGDISNYWVTEGAFGRIRARDEDTVIDPAGLVANMTCKKPDQKIKPYLKADLPKRLHFASSRRIEDVNVLVDTKWLFERYPGSLTFCAGGTHGYDNDAESMHAMFLSYGPKFHDKKEIEPFANIELYNLMCDLLEITPAENNGTHGSLNHLLRKPTYEPKRPQEPSKGSECWMSDLNPEDKLGCSCPAVNETVMNSRLNLTTDEFMTSLKKHLLFGKPWLLKPQKSYCTLHHEGFISAYSSESLMPLWTSFTMDKPMNLDPLPPVILDCLRADIRVEQYKTPTCDQYRNAGNVTHGFLYPPNLNETADQQYDALLMSNVVPMYPEFKKIWDYFQGTLLKKYANMYNGMNVVMGPAFDYNYNGQFDTPEQIQQFVSGTNIPIPTHFFVVMTSCKNSSKPARKCMLSGELQAVSFLLPHRHTNMESCKSADPESNWVEDLMWFHQARVRDVEWIAGLDFYVANDWRSRSELLRLKTLPTAANQRRPGN